MRELGKGLVEALAELPQGAELVRGTAEIVARQRAEREAAELRRQLDALRVEHRRLQDRAWEAVAEARVARYERDEAIRRADHATAEWAREHARRLTLEARAFADAPPAPAFAPGREIDAGGDREPSGAEIVRLRGKEDA
jgi:hypothetical protein